MTVPSVLVKACDQLAIIKIACLLMKGQRIFLKSIRSNPTLHLSLNYSERHNKIYINAGNPFFKK